MTERDIVERLGIKAGMISLGERIEFGSDATLMREAAAEITRLREMVTTAIATAREECAKIAEAQADADFSSAQKAGDAGSKSSLMDCHYTASEIAAAIRARTP